MGFKDSYIYKSVEAFFIGNADDRRINVEAATRKTGTDSLTGQLERKAITMQVQTLKEWKLAIMLATDPEEPNRSSLKDLYFNLKLDNHLMATISNRIESVQGAPFKLVDKNGEEQTEMTNVLKKVWFIDFIELALMSKYTGTKVIELYHLKEDGHLKEVEEVDMAHIVPEKGLIVKEPGDTTGWNYKEGIFQDYYLQVGKDHMLGLFAMLAPIVLAKKLGIGSWLDYIEKYGIPPMFVITDREDRKRFEELYENMLNFKSNHFGVLRGNETVQFGTSAQAGNSTVFKDLTKLANDEISKRINGATGSTDEKAHVGAAQVHADILKTKIKLDKFFIQVLVNEELIPRLVKLSPVYSGLENYTFEWDEAETLSLNELIDAVISLSSFYEIDIEYLSEKTGIPINGLKQLVPNLPTPDPKKGQKKKSEIDQTAVLVREFYAELIEGLQLEAIDLSTYTKLVERIAKGLHNGTITPESLNSSLINQIYADLAGGSADGWGKDWTKFGKDIGQDKTVLSIQKNIFRFSGAKTYAQLKEFNELLYKDGQLRSYQDFKAEVLKVNKRYNRNYLQAEHQTARQAGHHGRNWQEFQKDKDLFPNLEYRTVADERVREEHSVLHKIIKPIDDPFWDTYYPPNGWRCRCYVVQTTDDPTEDTPSDESVKPEFRVNVGKTGTVYSEKHPFFAIASSAGKEVQNAFELSKLHAPYGNVYKSKKGATVQVSPFVDQHDFEDNFNTAKKMADNNIPVKIRPHIILQGYKNPEYEIDKKMADRKSQKGKNVSSNIRAAKKQGAKIIVFEIHDDFPYSLNRFKSLLKGHLKHYKEGTFDEVIVIKDKVVERIKVSELLK
jgi:SPP1 gp7 family putative phage head morphogenesis protein